MNSTANGPVSFQALVSFAQQSHWAGNSRHFAPTPATILVWTIQHAACWQFLQQRGIHHAAARRVFHHFRPAYRWLKTQMHARIPGYAGETPIWFWYSPKPDLRHTALLPPGTPGVRIELELPNHRTLLFDFNTWHCVLNRWHLHLTAREEKDWDRKTKGYDQYNATLPPPLEQELQATWQRVFNLKHVTQIQGVTPYIRLSEVRSVQHFISR